jgi:UDP-N-acetylglucosamine transferase subunit ALG13
LTEVRALVRALVGHEVVYVLNDVVPLREGMEGRTHFIAHSQRDWRVLWNVVEAWRILKAEAPDVIVSTGAGPVVPFAFVGRLLGIPTVFVETFTRVTRPSLAARLVSPLAARFFFQWPGLAAYFPKGTCCGPIGVGPGGGQIGTPAGGMFVAVGNGTQPFPRILDAIEHACTTNGIDESRVLVQHGATQPRPWRGWRQVRTLPESEFQRALFDAEVVVCHAGAGVILEALALGKRCIVFPRRRAEGEVVDDHQRELAGALASEGLVQIADHGRALAMLLRESCGRPRSSLGGAGAFFGGPSRAVEMVRKAIEEVARK